MTDYTEALKIDKIGSKNYYQTSLAKKSEQQKLLEKLITDSNVKCDDIADIACGGGGTSYYLSQLFPYAKYTLVDLNEDAIVIAREATQHLDADYLVGDIYALELAVDRFDLVVCGQTLMALTEPQKAIKELVRICRPGGRIYASSLFNLNHDVDIFSTVIDHTRPSAVKGHSYTYNTYSMSSVRKWIEESVHEILLHEFKIPIDLDYRGRGLGTYTIKLDDENRLQMSAGMVLNWGILEVVK